MGGFGAGVGSIPSGRYAGGIAPLRSTIIR
jgi:hypothetical protein